MENRPVGVELYGLDEGPCPRPVFLRVTCNGDHEPSARPVAVFSADGLDGYIAQRSAAVRAGWRFSGDGNTYGPCCKRVKAVKEDAS